MKAAPAAELIELGQQLSPSQRREWLNYGRYLRARVNMTLRPASISACRRAKSH